MSISSQRTPAEVKRFLTTRGTKTRFEIAASVRGIVKSAPEHGAFIETETNNGATHMSTFVSKSTKVFLVTADKINPVIGMKTKIISLSPRPTGQVLAVLGEHGQCLLTLPAKKKTLRTYSVAYPHPQRVMFLAEQKLVVVCKNNVVFYNTTDGGDTAFEIGVEDVSFSACSDEKVYLLSKKDGKTTIVSYSMGSATPTIVPVDFDKIGNVNVTAFEAFNGLLYFVCGGSIVTFDTSSNSTHVHTHHLSNVSYLSVNSIGVLTVSDASVKVLDHSGKIFTSLMLPQHPSMAIMNASGTELVVGESDGTVHRYVKHTSKSAKKRGQVGDVSAAAELFATRKDEETIELEQEQAEEVRDAKLNVHRHKYKGALLTAMKSNMTVEALLYLLTGGRIVNAVQSLADAHYITVCDELATAIASPENKYARADLLGAAFYAINCNTQWSANTQNPDISTAMNGLLTAIRLASDHADAYSPLLREI